MIIATKSVDIQPAAVVVVVVFILMALSNWQVCCMCILLYRVSIKFRATKLNLIIDPVNSSSGGTKSLEQCSLFERRHPFKHLHSKRRVCLKQAS